MKNMTTKHICHLVLLLVILTSCNEMKREVNKIRLINGDDISFSEMDEFLSAQIAYLVMKMVEQGILDLDKPLYAYLPYPDISHDDRYQLITARMVLSHTSGFPNWRFFNEDKKLDIKFTPGTQFLYSGEGFEYLANVIAHLKNTNKDDLQDLFEEEVSTPLGMKNFFYTWNDDVAERRATGHVDGRVAGGYGISADNPHFYAAYSLQTEAIGYATFLIGMMLKKYAPPAAIFPESLRFW